MHVRGARGAAGDDDVADVGTHGEREVRRERPRRRGPGEGAHAGEPQRFGLDAGEREGDRHGRVLTHLVDVVVHAQLVAGQRRLVAPAVRQHAVALVREALLVQGLERPEDRLHVVRVERLVAALEVDPARLAGDVVLPLVRVREHRFAGLRVERVDPHRLDLGLLGDPELLHRLELRRQAVGVPAEDPIDLLAAHRLEAREEVLRVAGQQVAVVRESVRERRPVVEHPLLGAFALLDRRAERVILLPEGEHFLLDLGEPRARHDGRHASASKRRRPNERALGRSFHSSRLRCFLRGRLPGQGNRGTTPRCLATLRQAQGPRATLTAAVTGLPRSVLLTRRMPQPPSRVLPKTPR